MSIYGSIITPSLILRAFFRRYAAPLTERHEALDQKLALHKKFEKLKPLLEVAFEKSADSVPYWTWKTARILREANIELKKIIAFEIIKAARNNNISIEREFIPSVILATDFLLEQAGQGEIAFLATVDWLENTMKDENVPLFSLVKLLVSKPEILESVEKKMENFSTEDVTQFRKDEAEFEGDETYVIAHQLLDLKSKLEL